MFGIGFPEMLMILAIALIVIGPKKLPEIAKALGRGFSEFKRATDDFKRSVNEETQATQIRDQILQGGKIHPPGAASDPYPPTANADPDLGPTVAAAGQKEEKEEPAAQTDTPPEAATPDATSSKTETREQHNG